MSRKPDIQKLLAARLHAMQEAERLAAEGIELVRVGKIEEAKAAERRARIWCDRMKAVEAKMRKR